MNNTLSNILGHIVNGAKAGLTLNSRTAATGMSTGSIIAILQLNSGFIADKLGPDAVTWITIGVSILGALGVAGFRSDTTGPIGNNLGDVNE